MLVRRLRSRLLCCLFPQRPRSLHLGRWVEQSPQQYSHQAGNRRDAPSGQPLSVQTASGTSGDPLSDVAKLSYEPKGSNSDFRETHGYGVGTKWAQNKKIAQRSEHLLKRRTAYLLVAREAFCYERQNRPGSLDGFV